MLMAASAWLAPSAARLGQREFDEREQVGAVGGQHRGMVHGGDSRAHRAAASVIGACWQAAILAAVRACALRASIRKRADSWRASRHFPANSTDARRRGRERRLRRGSEQERTQAAGPGTARDRRRAGRAAAGRTRGASNCPRASTTRSWPAASITAHGARLRQEMYIAKVMRGVDVEPIRAALERRSEIDRQRVRREHATRTVARAPARRRARGLDRARRTDRPGRACSSCVRWPGRPGPSRPRARPPAASRQLFRRLREALENACDLAFFAAVCTMTAVKPLVGIIMGSTSDWETLKHAAEMLERLGVPHEVRVVSAHRTPDLLFEYAATARERGLAGHHRRRRRRCPPAGHVRGQDLAARARRAGAVEGAERPRLAALDRADAGRHSGRHAGDRRGRRDQRRAAGRVDPRQRATRRSARRSTRSARRRPTRSSPSPTRAARRSPHEDRRHRCGPARTHAGPGGLSAGACSSASSTRARTRPAARSRRSCTGAFDDPHSLERLAADVDLVTYEFENVPVAALQKVAQTHPGLAARRGAARLAGPPAREAAVREAQDPDARRSAPSTRSADLRAAVAGHRPALRAEDAPARLRRQGPALPAQARRRRARLGMRSAACR